RKGIVESLEHLIERDGERLKLTRPVGRGNPFLQVRRVNTSERSRHLFERSQPASGDDYCNEDCRQYAARKEYDKEDGEDRFHSLIARPVLRHLKRVSLPSRLGAD